MSLNQILLGTMLTIRTENGKCIIGRELVGLNGLVDLLGRGDSGLVSH